MLTRDSWFTIFKYLNKKQLRECAAVNKEFHEIIRDQQLITEAPWPCIDYRQIKKSRDDEFNLEDTTTRTHPLENGILIIAKIAQPLFYIWKIGDTQPTQRKSPENVGLLDATAVGSEMFATCGVRVITLWDTHQLEIIRTIPITKFSKNYSVPHSLHYVAEKQQFICVHRDSSITICHLQNQHQPIPFSNNLNLPPIELTIRQGNDLYLIHTQNYIDHTSLSVWDIKEATHKKQINLKDYLDHFCHLINKESTETLTPEAIDQLKKSYPIFVKTIHAGCLIVEMLGYVFFINLVENKPPLLLAKKQFHQHRINLQNDFVILNKQSDKFSVLAKYNPEINDFMMKKDISINKRWEHRNSLILPDGSIIIIYGHYKQVTKWDYTSQTKVDHFHFEKGLIPKTKKMISFTSLPNGDLLSWYDYHGIFAIHDGQTGALKTNHYFVVKEADQSFQTRTFTWTFLANGDLAIMRWLHKLGEDWDKKDLKICHFNLLTEKQTAATVIESHQQSRK